MKIAIRYFTKSKKGNTKKLADAVSAALEKEAFDVSVDPFYSEANISYLKDLTAEIDSGYAVLAEHSLKEE